MPITDQRASGVSGRIRRRRITTACVSCRDRRIKCDRLKPTCHACKKALRPCNYANAKIKDIEFQHITGTQPKPQLEDSWTSVLNHQLDISNEEISIFPQKPSWIMAEEEELSLLLPKRCIPRAHVTPINYLGPNFLTLLTTRLPSVELCETFFENFLRTVHPVVPICHIPTLERDYTNFWKNVSFDTSAELLLLVVAVLYTGSHNAPCSDKSSSTTLLDLYSEVASHLDLASYYIRNRDAALKLLQAHLIVNTYCANQLAPFAAFGFLPQAIRFGQMLKLHVERHNPTNDKISSDNMCEAGYVEAQRRTWYHLVFLDVESVIANGLPPIIRSDGYTTKLPSMTSDHELSFTSATQENDSADPMMVAMQGHCQWARHMQKWFEFLPTHNEVTSFKVLIEQILLSVPEKDSIENKWARKYLKMQIDRAYCMLGLRFWQLDRFTSTGCQSEVVRTARSFLAHYLALSSISLELSWFLPGLIQPIHALIILLMHLSTCPDLCSEERLSRLLLDNVFELRVSRILAGTIISEKAEIKGEKIPQRANSRYSMLVDLRSRVWKRCGWDKDGKGKDPWNGRLDDLDEVEDADRYQNQAVDLDVVAEAGSDEGQQHLAASSTLQLESPEFLDEDLLDMFHWDQWEGLTEGLFVS